MIRSALLAAALLALAAAPALAKPAKASAETGLTGMWILESRDFGKERQMPLTPFAQKMLDDEHKSVAAGNVIGSKTCGPSGMPSMMANEFATEFLETPGRITVVNESANVVRTIYMDETKHTEGLEPSWNGHSIGHWQGKGAARTLVVDTVNFNDKTNPFGFIGVHSSTTHLVERFHLENGGKNLVGEFTFEDPRLLTKPIVQVVHYKRLPPHSELWEYACEPNGKGWADRFENDPQGTGTAAPKAPQS